jgi:hypothetical protein
MDKDAVKFVLERSAMRSGIIAHPVYAYKNITFDSALYVGIVEGDDVCERIVIEILNVDLVQVVVRAENVSQTYQFMLVLLYNVCDPVGNLFWVIQREFDVLAEELN